ncbi:MAG: SpoIIE family protein phosphatase [Fuerstiella sp.]|nr:SpoIIE family protein phosphatase [Fuerstiella sp.]MCP4855688.1 SpoIIE family protein phosphatase [Fuerstiella sp.]
MRILVCWDDAAQVELLKMYLSLDDNAVFATTDRDQFLTFVNSPQTFDVILMSASHPDYDTGFETFQMITESRPTCPVVAACPQSDVYRIARFMTAGLRSYLIRDDNGDFMFLVQAILEAAVRQVDTERERQISAQLRKEVESVRELQESIIPNDIETPEGFKITARYESSQIRVIGSQPVTMAGGDYYEAFTLPDNRIVMLVGDASGHGMKACMSIFTMHTLIRMIRFDDYIDTAKLVKHINHELCKQSVVSGEGGFITMLYGVFDTKTRELSWASAGHQMPVLHNLDTDEIFEVAEAEEASGLPIGIFEDGDYVNNVTIIPPRSRLLLYTDGLIEAFPSGSPEDHVEFGLDGMERTMRAAKDKSVTECMDSLFSESFEFTQGAGRHDDTSIMILESE